jgi:hypothetical protein
MNLRFAAILTVIVFVLVPALAYAGTATWDLNPGSGDWNTATNWTPVTVPNGSTDTGTFGASNTTDVSFSENTEVNGIAFTPAATNPYTVTANPGVTLTVSGAGITNNATTTQNFMTAVNSFDQHGVILFRNNATAGIHTIFTNSGGIVTFGSGGGVTMFLNSSTAGGATIANNGGMTNFQPGAGSTVFANTSTAENATIINNGGAVNGAFDGAFTRFINSSTAGSATFTNNAGTAQGAGSGFTMFEDFSNAGSGLFMNNGSTAGLSAQPFFGTVTHFRDSSSADNGTFINNGGFVIGQTLFGGSSTAGSGIFVNNGGTISGAQGGATSFTENSTASNGTLTNNAGTADGALGGSTTFSDSASGGDATIINNGSNVVGGGSGQTIFSGFFGTSTAGNARIINNASTVSGAAGGQTIFSSTFGLGTSTAGNATIIANGSSGAGQGGAILFGRNSDGGTSRIEVFGDGKLDISLPGAGAVTVGSIEGNGNVFLGGNTLGVGSNNLSTTFSGVIQDGGVNGGTGGSLNKIGTGTLMLSGVNTYTGDTHVFGGVLAVDGSIMSNTFLEGSTLAGTGAVHGNVTNTFFGTVSPGDAPGTLTVNSYTQGRNGTLLIDIAGPNTGQFSVLDVLGNANLGGVLDIGLLNGFIPTIGESFDFVDYSGLTGAFFGIQDPTFDNGLEHWSVTYQPTFAVLTVESGPGGPGVTVPDQGSTLLLLTLSVLGLVTYRHPLLRKQG